jgi:hypothetical protein
LASSISGTPITYAGGGGGGGNSVAPASNTLVGKGGSFPSTAPAQSPAPGGGGNGAHSNQPGFLVAGPGGDNTGGGGGGAAWSDAPGGASLPLVGGSGGKGIVIIRYGDNFGQQAGGGTITTPAGYIVHTFTGDGTFTTNANFRTVFSVN